MQANRQPGKPPFMPNGPFNDLLKGDRGLLPLSRPRSQAPQPHQAYIPRALRPGFRGVVGRGEYHGQIFDANISALAAYERLPVYTSGPVVHPVLREGQRIHEVEAIYITAPQQYGRLQYSEPVPNRIYSNPIMGVGPAPTAMHAADFESSQQLRLHPASSHNADTAGKPYRGSRGGAMRRRKRGDYNKSDKSVMLPPEGLSSYTPNAAPGTVLVSAPSAQDSPEATPAAPSVNAAPQHHLRAESAPFVPARALPRTNHLRDPKSYYRAYILRPAPDALAVRFAPDRKLPKPGNDEDWKKIEKMKHLWNTSAATISTHFPALLSSESTTARTTSSLTFSATAGPNRSAGKNFILYEDAAGLGEEMDGEKLKIEELTQMVRDKALSAGRTAALVLHGSESGLWRNFNV